MDRDELFRHLDENSDVFRNPAVRAAFGAVDRADFVGEDYRSEAYEDYMLPQIGGQSVMKPTVAAFMLEILGAGPGERVLEVGCGSGWVTALIAHMVGKTGNVTGVELVPELADMARSNLAKLSMSRVRIVNAGKALGFREGAPYDRIISAASANEVPGELLGQLKNGGTLVMPVRGSIVKIVKDESGRLLETSYPGTFAFPELVE